MLAFVVACADGSDEPEWVSDIDDPQLHWCAADASEAGLTEEEAMRNCALPWTFVGRNTVLMTMTLDYGAMASAQHENTAQVRVTLNEDGTAESEMVYLPEEGNQSFFVGGCAPGTVGGANQGEGSVESAPLPTALTTKWTGRHDRGVITFDTYAEYVVSGANIDIGETTITSAVTYTRETLAGTAQAVSVNDPLGCGTSTYTEDHTFNVE